MADGEPMAAKRCLLAHGVSDRMREMQALLRDAKESGLPLREFARQRGIRHSTLVWWRGQLQLRERDRRRRSEIARRAAKELRKRPELEMLPVRVVGGFRAEPPPDAVAPEERIVIMLRSGRRIEAPASIDDVTLRRLIHLLEGSC
jgi:hypothetical protein